MKTKIFPSRGISGFVKKQDPIDVYFSNIELQSDQDDVGVDMFLYSDYNDDFVCTVLSPDEAEHLAESLMRYAKIEREYAKSVESKTEQ